MKSFNMNTGFALALILGCGIAFTQSAQLPVKTVKLTGTEYQFNGTEASQMQTASEYSVVSGSGPSCDDSDVLPCTINVSGNLQTWLNEHTDAQILAAADQTKD